MKHTFQAFFLCLVFAILALSGRGIAYAQDAQKPALSANEELHQTLQSPSAKPAAPGTNPYADLPDEYIIEAKKYYTRCNTTQNLRLYYNCKCMASEYLDQRIKQGPGAPQSNIITAISRKCPDASGAAGYEYKKCLTNAPLMPQEIPPEEYCTCYANTYAKLYEKNKSGASSQVFVRLQSRALTLCSNPENSRKFQSRDVAPDPTKKSD